MSASVCSSCIAQVHLSVMLHQHASSTLRLLLLVDDDSVISCSWSSFFFLFWSKGGGKEELMRGKVSPSCFPLPVRFLENERQTGWKTREHAGTHVHLNNVLAIGLILHQFVVSLSLCQTAPIVIHRIGHSLTPEWTCDSIVKFTHRWCLHSRIIVHITF